MTLPPPRPSFSPANAAVRASRHALIVDDSRVVRKVAQRILSGLGFLTREAENGEEALAACATLMPDAILLDWNMPVMDGMTFLHELRGRDRGLVPKVVFCTSENDVSQITRALHAGADEYIMKPFDAQVVESKFEQIGLGPA